MGKLSEVLKVKAGDDIIEEHIANSHIFKGYATEQIVYSAIISLCIGS